MVSRENGWVSEEGEWVSEGCGFKCNDRIVII